MAVGFYIVSDSSLMDIGDFIQYLKFMKKENSKFKFSEWFDECDFTNFIIYQTLTIEYN